MKVILLKDVPKVGNRDDVQTVADGYAINFLIPHGLAKKATNKEVIQLEKLEEKTKEKKSAEKSELAKKLKEIKGRDIVLEEKVNDKGHLFAKVHRAEVVSALKKQADIDLGPEAILLEEPIKEVGEFEIPIRAGPDRPGEPRANIKLVVKPLEEK